MQILEPIILQNIDKDVSPNGLDYSGRKVLNPLRDVLNGRYLSSVDGEDYQLESIRGTVEQVNAALPEGINECIGTYENIERNILVFFIWNNNGFHGVYKYNGSDGSIDQLLEDDPNDPVLNFSNSPKYNITGVSMMGDILIWTDNLNPQRYINITRSYTLHDFRISLIKIGPRSRPRLRTELFQQGIGYASDDKETDGALVYNKIADNSFQFAYRYVYWDNENSVLSPYSKILMADAYGKDIVFTSTRNKALITHTIDSDVANMIKRVELCVRINNDAQWRVWKKVTTFGSSIAEYFYNDSPGELIDEVSSSKLYDAVPNKSKALTIFKNRVFLNISEEGMDVPGVTVTPTLTADKDTTTADTAPQITPVRSRRPFVKKNGSYSIGLAASDKFGRYVGVYAKAKLAGKALEMAKSFDFTVNNAEDADNVAANRINVALSGLVPENSRYSIVATPELQYQSYQQMVAGIIFYVREYGDLDAQSGQVRVSSRIYLERYTNVNSYDWSYCHICLPDEMSFVPDKDCYVRIINSENQAVVEKVIEVLEGNILVTGKFEGIDFATYPDIGPQWKFIFTFGDTMGVLGFVEVFKLKTTPEVFYYEVAGPFSSDAGGTLLTSAVDDIEADTYYRGALHSGNDQNKRSFRVKGMGKISLDESVAVRSIETESATQTETPSPTYLSGSFTDTTREAQAVVNAFDGKGYTPDYSKSAWGRGRVFVEASAELLRRPSTIRFSDTFIEGSNINGLNSFPFDNVYDKIGQDRSPITKIVPVGNILVAVHERQVTSIYVGESIVRSGPDGALTSKVEGVIGDDRKLIGTLGSAHPESVQEIDGRLFGWDIYSGVVWRYTVEGLSPISNKGMQGFFRDLARRYFPQRERLKFVGGIDKDNNEYLLTLPALYEDLDVAPVQASGPSTTLPGAGMEPLLDWEDLGHEWAVLSGAQRETENAGAPPSPWLKGGLVTVAGYTYNFSTATFIEDDNANNDFIVEFAILDAAESVLDSVSFPYSGITGTSNESFGLTPPVAGTHVGVRFENNTPLDSKTIGVSQVTFDSYVTTANSALTYDFVLNPANYTVGETYRLKLIAYKQGATDNDFVTIDLYGDGLTAIYTDLDYEVVSDDPDESTELFVEFIYTGQSFIRVQVNGIDFPIFVLVSSQEQTLAGETWAFNYEKNVWSHRYSFVPEFMGRLNNELLSFKNGRLYKHNASDTYNNFYGVQYEREFTFSANPQPNKVKTWSAVQIAATSVAATETGTKKIVEVTNEHGQSSYTRVKEFEKKEGVYYGPILKDVNTNPALLTGSQIALRNGKEIRSKAVTVTIRNDRTDVSRLQKVNIVGEYSEFSN